LSTFAVNNKKIDRKSITLESALADGTTDPSVGETFLEYSI